MKVADESAELYVSAYVGYGGEGEVGVCCVVYG